MIFSVENLGCGYNGKAIVEDICFTMESGEVVCLLGPNGVGKTTFFRTVQGFLPAVSGRVFAGGHELRSLPRREIAKLIAYVPQAREQSFAYSVYDMILMGRAAFVKNFSSPGKRDHEICEEMLRRLSLEGLRDKLFNQISGGEQQLVLIARAMVQQPLIMMMDEPTSNLDFGNQVHVLRQISRLSQENKIGILMTTHSPEQALNCADKVVLFRKNKPVLVGTPEEILTEDILMDAYGVKVRFISAEDEDGTVLKSCIPVLRG